MGKLGGLAIAFWLAAPRAEALVVVTVQPVAPSVAVGDTVTVDLVADFSGPDDVLAWGLDLVLDPARVGVVGSPALGPTWLPFVTPDGDGLGGVAPAGVTGTHLLASVTLEGLAIGTTALDLAVTSGHLTEGFALDPVGFATDVTFHGATLSVVPEPAVGLLLPGAAVALAAGRLANPPQGAAAARRRCSARKRCSTMGMIASA